MKRSQRHPLQKTTGRRWLGLALLVVLLILISNREFVEDQLNLATKAPSAEIERLAQATTMTPLAKRLFYRQDPVIKPRSEFLEICEAPEETIVLGCYTQKKLGDRIISGDIIIQQITDPQFQGIMEVTAAHEMLHVAYSQLNPAEERELVSHLRTAAERVTNKRLLKVLNGYQATDTDLYHNELHSHLGTELESFEDPVLETHYQRYFGDRQRVVAFAQQSVRVISQLDQQAEALKVEIDQLEAELEQSRQQIEQTELRLNRGSEALDIQQRQLEQTQASAEAAIRQNKSTANSLIDRFEREKQAFNREVEDHNARVRTHGDRVEHFNQKIQTYQKKVDSYNQVAQENRKVLESLQGPLPMEPKANPTAEVEAAP